MDRAALIREACRIYNEFADLMREQGEIIPRWDADVCDLAGTEVLAWMEFAKRQRVELHRLEHKVSFLDRKLYNLEKSYHQRISAAMRTMEMWRQKIFAHPQS